MEIRSTIKMRTGGIFPVIHREKDPREDLGNKILWGVQGFCFYGDKLVLIKHPKSGWMPPGGGIEEGETLEETIVREIKEETNMRVLRKEIISYLEVAEPNRTIRQTRFFCEVEPCGPFTGDPDGEISEMILIDPKDYKDYFNWGDIGDRVMEVALAKLKNK